MIGTLTLLLKIVFSILILVGSFKGLIQLKHFKYTKFNQFLFFEALIAYGFCQFYDQPLIESCSLGVIQGSFLSLLIANFLDEVDSKKNKVLWRVPIIFGLITYSFTPMEVELGFIVLEIVMLIVSFQFRERFNYFYRQQFKAVLSCILCLLSFYFDNIYFLIGIILIINLKFQMINSVKLKLKMRETRD